MRTWTKGATAAALLVLSGFAGAYAQTPTAPQDSAKPLEIGAVAPDFALPGATRHGVLREPVHLSDYQGKTVVLAFFFKARTKG